MAHLMVVYLTCAFFGKAARATDLKLPVTVHQERGFVSANVGDAITLQCVYGGDVARHYWYKQTLGQNPRLISSLYMYQRSATFYNEFKNNPRFTLESDKDTNNLTITDLHLSDSATYYCATSYTIIFEFAEGTTVSVKGSGLNIQTLVQQSASATVQPGGALTLNCTVHSGTCDGEHSVYWFRSSEEPHPGLIYTHGARNDQCERNPNTQTHTCVYTLPMKSLDPSHAGTYYCAVAACGRVLFGDGTKLDIEREVDLLFLVYFWSGAAAFATVLSVALASLVCVMSKRNGCPCGDPQERSSAAPKANVKDYKDGDKLSSTALREVKMKSSRGLRDDTWSECVYFNVKQ